MGGYHWNMCNYLSVRRDPYIVIASMQESDTGSVYTKEGLFVDLYEDKYPVVERVLVEPGQEKLLFDLEKIKEDVRIIATAARIENMACENGQLSIEAKAGEYEDPPARETGRFMCTYRKREKHGTAVCMG